MRSSFYILAVFALNIWAAPSSAEVRVEQIAVNANNPQIRQIKGPHLLFVDDTAAPNGLLLISIGGTNSSPEQFAHAHRIAAAQGYLGLSVDYPNEVISTVCRERREIECYDSYRAEIVLGHPVSPVVHVDRANSIESRIVDLLRGLLRKDSARWSPYVNTDGSLNWQKIVLMGHSQGSGHAVYLSKRHRVQAVIMTGGPQDWLPRTGPSRWIMQPGQTPASAYFAFLHRDDFFGSESQILLARVLLENPQAPLSRIQDRVADGETAQILVSELNTPDPHNSMLRPIFPQVWQHIFQRSVNAPHSVPPEN